MANNEQAKKSNLFSKKEKKQLTPAQKKLKLAGGWIVNILCILIILFSLIVAIVTIIGNQNEGLANLFGTVFMPVKSDSMTGVFEEDDLILSKVYKGDGSDLKEGQVVTVRKVNPDGSVYYNTHKINRITGEPGSITIFTIGVKQGATEDPGVKLESIKATWGSVDAEGNIVKGKTWKGVGAMSNWLQDAEHGKVRFFCAIVLPLILLFVGYAFVLIRTLVIAKIQAAKESAAAAVAAPITADSLSDEEKRRLAEEYLNSLKAQADALNNAPKPESAESSSEQPGSTEN